MKTDSEYLRLIYKELRRQNKALGLLVKPVAMPRQTLPDDPDERRITAMLNAALGQPGAFTVTKRGSYRFEVLADFARIVGEQGTHQLKAFATLIDNVVKVNNCTIDAYVYNVKASAAKWGNRND